jgi:hypothetical protein
MMSMTMMSTTRHAFTLSALLALVACGADPADQPSGAPSDAVATAEARTPVHVDSVFPIEEDLRRFREGMTPVDTLSGGADSRAALVDALLRRLEAADTLGIAELGMTPAEFAWLYYPHTMYTSPPYELAPGLVWFQLQNVSSRGLSRLLQAYAGKTLHDTGHRCPDEGEPFGTGRIWHGCSVEGMVRPEDADPDAAPVPVEERLFGSILEVGGRYKFVSFAGEF